MLAPVLLALLLLVLGWRWRASRDDPLSQLPGPRGLPGLGLALNLIGVKPGELFLRIREYKKIYGDRFIIKVLNRRIVQICNPDDVEIVLSSSKNISKSLPYMFLEPWLGTGLLLSTGKKWLIRRKVLTPTFHFNVLRSFSQVMEEGSRRLVQTLAAAQEVDLVPVVSDFTLHTICETAMGTQLSSDKSHSSREYKEAIISIGSHTLARLTKFWLQSDWIFNMSETGKRFYEALGKVHSFADIVIVERKNNWKDISDISECNELGSKRRLAMLDLLLAAEARGEIDRRGVREEVNTFMFEGHDTTAMALTFALMLIAEHEDVQEKIYQECQSILGSSDRSPTLAELTEMKYLEAVIKETLRLYPSVPFIAREITEDFILGDVLVKRGTEVALHIYDLHRRPDLFPDPDRFDPDRFLSGSPRHPYAYVPFSAGPRNCIGQKFAMQEMKIVLSRVCRGLRLRRSAPPPPLVADLVLRPAGPVLVSFCKR